MWEEPEEDDFEYRHPIATQLLIGGLSGAFLGLLAALTLLI